MSESCCGMFLCATRTAADVLARDASLLAVGDAVHLVPASTLPRSQRKAIQCVQQCIESYVATAVGSPGMFSLPHAGTAAATQLRFAVLPSHLLHYCDDVKSHCAACCLCVDLDMVIAHGSEVGRVNNTTAHNARELSVGRYGTTFDHDLWVRYCDLTQKEVCAAQASGPPRSDTAHHPAPPVLRHVLVLVLDECSTAAEGGAGPVLPALVRRPTTQPPSVGTSVYQPGDTLRVYRYPSTLLCRPSPTLEPRACEVDCPSWLLLRRGRPPQRLPATQAEEINAQAGSEGNWVSRCDANTATNKSPPPAAHSTSDASARLIMLSCDYLLTSVYFATWCEPCDFTWRQPSVRRTIDMLSAVIHVALAPSVAAAEAVHDGERSDSVAVVAETGLLRRAIAAFEAEAAYGRSSLAEWTTKRRRLQRQRETCGEQEEMYRQCDHTDAADAHTDRDAETRAAVAVHEMDWAQVARQGWRGQYDSYGAQGATPVWGDRWRAREEVVRHMDRLCVQDMCASLCVTEDEAAEWRCLRRAYQVALLPPTTSGVFAVSGSSRSTWSCQGAPRLDAERQRHMLAAPTIPLTWLLRDITAACNGLPHDMMQTTELADLDRSTWGTRTHAASLGEGRQLWCQGGMPGCSSPSSPSVLLSCVGDAVRALYCTKKCSSDSCTHDLVNHTIMQSCAEIVPPGSPRGNAAVNATGVDVCESMSHAMQNVVQRHEMKVRRLCRPVFAHRRNALSLMRGGKRHRVGAALRYFCQCLATRVDEQDTPSSTISGSVKDDSESRQDNFSNRHGVTSVSVFAQVASGCDHDDDDTNALRATHRSLCWAPAASLSVMAPQTEVAVHDTEAIGAATMYCTASQSKEPVGAKQVGWLRHVAFLLIHSGKVDEAGSMNDVLVASPAFSVATSSTRHRYSASEQQLQQALSLFRAANAHLLGFDEAIAAVCTAIQHRWAVATGSVTL